MTTPEKVLVSASTETLATSLPVAHPTKRERLWLGISLCAISGISYGAQALFVKWAYAEGVNTTTVLTMRFVVAAVGCWLLVALIRPAVRLPASQVAKIGSLGLIFVFNALLYYLALDKLEAGTAALIGSSFPGWVVLWSVLFLKERMDKQRAGALLLALLGCVLTVDPFSLVGASAAKFSFEGVFLALGSALSYSFYILLAGRFGKGVPGLVAAAYSVPATALVYIGWCILSGQFQWGMSGLGWLYCLVIGVGAALAIGCYQTGIQLIGPVRASITATTEPATAVLLGIIILNENANLVKLVGGSLILGAVLLLSRPRKELAR